MRTRTRTHAYTSFTAVAAAVLIALVILLAPQGAARAADDADQLTAGAITEQSALDTEAASNAIVPGVYYIQSQLNGEFLLDVEGNSKKDGTNVQLYSWDSTNAEKWKVAKTANGSYTITCIGTGKCLDITGADFSSGTNVQQYKANGSTAQQWKITRKGSGYTISPASKSSLKLDVYGAIAKDGSNVQIYDSNGSIAQQWWFIPTKPTVKSERVLKDGAYELRLASATSYVIDSADDTLVNGANVELNKRDSSMSQRWYIHWNSAGYYTVHNISTGKVLDVAGDSPAAHANVQSYAINGTAAQHWAISRTADGSYLFQCVASGNALDVKGARAANGTNVQMMPLTKGASQRIRVKRCSSMLPNDTYVIYSMLAPLKSVVSMPNGTKKNGAQAQLYSANGSIAERFYLRKVSRNTYTIQSVSSGKYLTDSAGKVIQRKRSGKKTQQWTVALSGSGLAFTNVATGKRMAVSGVGAADGTKLITATAATRKTQQFHLAKTRLIPDGYYEFSNAKSGKRLDVYGGSLLNDANVQIYAPNKTAAQVWKVTYEDEGYYKILNDGSGKALDVVGGSVDAGANVQQYTDNKSAAQRWRPTLRADGAITFVNKGSSMALEAAGTGNEANVRQGPKIGKATQGWYLTSTISRKLSGNAELDGFIHTVVNKNDGDLKKCFSWLKANVEHVNSISTTTPATGLIANQTTIDQALYVFKNKKADSYYFASAFKWLAIGCGYPAEARSGKISTTTGEPTAHGWTEVTKGGQTYVCDVDLAVTVGGGYAWYLTSYDSAPVRYYL